MRTISIYVVGGTKQPNGLPRMITGEIRIDSGSSLEDDLIVQVVHEAMDEIGRRLKSNFPEVDGVGHVSVR